MIRTDHERESLRGLFQQEFARIVAVISKRFGLQHIELAEDVVSETFLLAAETWGVRGLPPNPTAWLYAVARQKTLYHLRRNRLLTTKIIPELTAQLSEADEEQIDLDFSPQTIRDSQLQMLFAICTPLIADEARIGLALRILCGLGIDEIAEAFLTNKETINKRLFRAKEKLRRFNVKLEMPPESALGNRLDSVLRVIYLLFNEGYYSKTRNRTLQKDLCLEALRLGVMLTDYERTNVPKTNALLALMCFHASRFNARQISDGSLLLYEQQNEALWDTSLIRQGFHYLAQSLHGNELSTYHLEARIASWHCAKADSPEKWAAILALYNQLLLVNKSSSAALNRTYALYKVSGPEAALTAAANLRLDRNHLYWILLGELHRQTDTRQAKAAFQRAYALAKSATDRQTIQDKLNQLG